MNKKEKKLLKYFENSTKADLNYQRIANKLGIYPNYIEKKPTFYLLKSLSYAATFGILLVISIILPFTSVQTKNSTYTTDSFNQSIDADHQEVSISTNHETMQPPSASSPTIVFQGEKYALEVEYDGIDFGYDDENPLLHYLGDVGKYKIYSYNDQYLLAMDVETKRFYELEKISEN